MKAEKTINVRCSSCGSSYPATETPFTCQCGSLWDLAQVPVYSGKNHYPGQIGLWKYRSLLGLPDAAPIVTLGEGATPLLGDTFGGVPIHYKLESQNPTGSYKDRGSAVLVSFLRSRGITAVVEDSSGNAGASLAAYCARAGIAARVFIPESAAGPKRWQIEMFGAEVQSIPGARANAAAAVLSAARAGVTYASHAYMPFGLTGIATIAYEIFEELGTIPGTVIAPVGHGGLLYGLLLGFESIVAAGSSRKIPHFIGVQSAACAPAVEAFNRKMIDVPDIISSPTLAEGASVTKPMRVGQILKRMITTGAGSMVSVSEQHLREAYFTIARRGIFCEPTACLPLAPLLDDKIEVIEPVVAILTGSGLKTNIIPA